MVRRVAPFLWAALLCAQVPPQDSRNTYIPDTNTHFRMPAYHTLSEWEARKAHLRRQILSAAGLLPMPEKAPLHAEVFGRLERGNYSIEKVLLETRPGYYLGGNLYRPLGRSGRFPGIVSPHGHWTYGRLENTALASVPARCIMLARQGYVVFSYDMVGYDDTRQTPHAFGAEPRQQLWSFGPLGLQLWNSIRAVDFLQSLPDVDPDRIGATGASGGGTQTFLLAAVDDRIQFDAPVNMLSFIMQGGSPCENAPNLRVDAINVEFGAMMAPRPMLMVNATGDWTHNTPREEYPAVRSIYELYGKPGNVETYQVDAPHNYNQESREAVYRFFAKVALGDPDGSRYREHGVHVEALGDMLALFGRTLPPGALTFDQLFEQWVRAAKAQNDAASDRAALRERLELALMSEWPARVLSQGAGDQLVLGREGRGDRVPAIHIAGRGRPVLVVGPEGAQAARDTSEVKQLLAAGRPVLLIDAFQTGRAATAGRPTRKPHYLTFNRSDDADRVQDILTALAYLKQSGAGPVELLGLGKAAVWSLFAAAVAPMPVTLTGKLDGFDGSDRAFIDDCFVPGIQRAGGLRAAEFLVKH